MIHVKNITKIFNEGTSKEFCALKDISLHVRRGDISLISGVSGSGKSTLLALIAGLYKPSYGEVIVDNKSISKLPEHFMSRFRRKKIGIIFQNFNLIPTLNVLENILLPIVPDKKDVSLCALDLLEKFDIIDKKDALAKNLSGGEQQRVAIVRALINSPSIILADEPTANLDKKMSIKFLDFIEMIQEDGYTIVVSSHDELLLHWKKINSHHMLEKSDL